MRTETDSRGWQRLARRPRARSIRPRWAAIAWAAWLVGCQASEAPAASTPPAIVFDWSQSGDRTIYRATLDGRDPLRLTFDLADVEHPSERAGTVVFTSYRDGHGELYAVSATGGPERRLTVTAANETEPALSPDAQHIAYVSDVSGVPKLWVAAADGTGARPLTAGFGFPGSLDASPSWAPGSDRVVFVSTASGAANLFVVAIAGGAPTPLVSETSTDVEPAWSPDGKLIAFASTRDGSGGTNIYTVAVATGAIQQLTHGTGTQGQPAWLPDGRIVYTLWAHGVPQLRWLDPVVPDSSVGIPLGSGGVQHAAAVF